MNYSTESEQARFEWVKSIFADADKLDLEKYVASFTEDDRF
jgi:hypothetical protein